MPRRDLIVIGGSAGGVAPTCAIVGALEPALPAAVVVVHQLPPDASSHLAAILARSGPLAAAEARDGESLHTGLIYTAVPTATCSSSPGGCACCAAPWRTAVAPPSTRCSGPRPRRTARASSRCC